MGSIDVRPLTDPDRERVEAFVTERWRSMIETDGRGDLPFPLDDTFRDGRGRARRLLDDWTVPHE